MPVGEGESGTPGGVGIEMASIAPVATSTLTSAMRSPPVIVLVRKSYEALKTNPPDSNDAFVPGTTSGTFDIQPSDPSAFTSKATPQSPELLAPPARMVLPVPVIAP